MVKTFMDYWIEENNWKQFYLKIHKLGFRVKMHNLAMKKLLSNKPHKASFSPNMDFYTPDFMKEDAREMESNAQMVI